LVTLVERENATHDQHWTAFRNGSRERIDESYAEYYAVVLGLANQTRKQGLSNPALAVRIRRALVFGTYNSDSEFAKDLAREGETIVPLVIELSKHPEPPKQWNAYGLAGEMFVHADAGQLIAPLTASSAALLRVMARSGLLDPSAAVRREAVIAVSKARDKEAMPLLERLATSDPDAKGPFSVRARAANAVTQLR
jgi:HEAT repeat protein